MSKKLRTFQTIFIGLASVLTDFLDDKGIYFTVGKIGAERTFSILCDDRQRDEINAFLDTQTIGCE